MFGIRTHFGCYFDGTDDGQIFQRQELNIYFNSLRDQFDSGSAPVLPKIKPYLMENTWIAPIRQASFTSGIGLPLPSQPAVRCSGYVGSQATPSIIAAQPSGHA